MQRWILALVLLAACGEGAGSGPGGGSGGGWGGRGGARSEPITIVEVDPVGRGDVSDVLVTNAVVESDRAADVMPSASGIVLSIAKEEGDGVRRGEVLAVLENVSLDVGAERARAEVAQLEDQLRGMQELAARGAVSQRELADLEYRLSTARATLREASHLAGQTRLTAPFDGVVAAREIKVGELAGSGKRAFQVVDLDALRVVASLPERDVARVAVGQRARLVSAYDAELFAWGEVTRVAPVIDATSGTFRVTVALAADQSALRPGQFVSVELEVDRHEQAIVVPRRALVYEDGAPVVYRMIDRPPEDPEKKKPGQDASPWAKKGEGGGFSLFGGGKPAAEGSEKKAPEPSPYVAERVAVELGLVDAEWAEVVGGLAEGDAVIVVGQANLRDGSPVLTPAQQAERKAKAEAAEADKDGGEEG